MRRNRTRNGRLGRSSAAPTGAKANRLPAKFRLDRILPGTLDPQTGRLKGGFESVTDAEQEDTKRARLIRGAVAANSQKNKSKKRPKPQTSLPTINPQEAEALREKLELGLSTGEPQPTLTSSLYFREVRLTTVGALLEATDNIPDHELRVVTVINAGWAYSPAQINGVTAETIKGQFRTHLERAKINQIPGFLIGFLHGEFEPTSGIYLLHYHLLTTAKKAAALKDRLNRRWGYEETTTGANPIVRQRIRDRPQQFSYLFQAYWPEKSVVMIDGQPKRTRTKRRVREPYHTQYLLWLNRQNLSTVMICNKCLYRDGALYI